MSNLPSSLNMLPLSTLPIPKIDKQLKNSGSRLKFWNLDSHYHCAALGTCLTLKELRQLGKKAKVNEIETWGDYQTHVAFLHALDKKCYLSVLVNKLLDQKYKKSISYFSKTKTEEERIELWNKAVSTGDIAGAFWAMLTHPATIKDTLYKIYGKVHMLSHLSGATARIDMRDFHNLQLRNDDLENQLNTNEIDFKKKLDKKENQLSDLASKFQKLKQEKNQLKHAEAELNQLKDSTLIEQYKDENLQLHVDLKSHQLVAKRAMKESKNLQSQLLQEQKIKADSEHHLERLIAEKESIENTLASLLNQREDGVESCESCPNTNEDLCGRCVLYIGGRNSQYVHFRQLVEQQNGAFMHHDGGREDGHQKLASIVSKADVVVCPLDCVSHTAMNAVKRHCQNNTKQLVFIPHASLSAFSKGLIEVMN